MATTQQTQANRANARRSTGPSTAAGKVKSSLNALKHGLRAQTTVLPGENIDDFHVLVAELEDHSQPANVLEWTLLRQLADAEWRMRRVPHIEAGALARQLHESREHYERHPDQLPGDADSDEAFLVGAMAAHDAGEADVLSKLSRYEARLSHRYFKALEHLRQAQDHRKSEVRPASPAGEDNPAGTDNPRGPSSLGQGGTDNPRGRSGSSPSRPARARAARLKTAKTAKRRQTNPIPKPHNPAQESAAEPPAAAPGPAGQSRAPKTCQQRTPGLALWSHHHRNVQTDQTKPIRPMLSTPLRKPNRDQVCPRADLAPKSPLPGGPTILTA